MLVHLHLLGVQSKALTHKAPFEGLLLQRPPLPFFSKISPNHSGPAVENEQTKSCQILTSIYHTGDESGTKIVLCFVFDQFLRTAEQIDKCGG